MLKGLLFFLAFLLLSGLLGILPAGQSSQTATLFGPETFVRGTGKPVTEAWQFSSGCFQGPFLFHLRNGDAHGKNSVSSAEVWLDGNRLFKQSDFSQQVSGYDIPVNLLPQSTLEVKLNSAPKSYLKIWIEGTPLNLFQPEGIRILPSGGRYRLSNGIKLEIPVGAVSAPTALQFRRITEGEIQLILNGPSWHPRLFMAGFDLEPRGFKFNTPITISLPSEPLANSTCLPFVINFNPSTGDQSLD